MKTDARGRVLRERTDPKSVRRGHPVTASMAETDVRLSSPSVLTREEQFLSSRLVTLDSAVRPRVVRPTPSITRFVAVLKAERPAKLCRDEQFRIVKTPVCVSTGRTSVVREPQPVTVRLAETFVNAGRARTGRAVSTRVSVTTSTRKRRACKSLKAFPIKTSVLLTPETTTHPPSSEDRRGLFIIVIPTDAAVIQVPFHWENQVVRAGLSLTNIETGTGAAAPRARPARDCNAVLLVTVKAMVFDTPSSPARERREGQSLTRRLRRLARFRSPCRLVTAHRVTERDCRAVIPPSPSRDVAGTSERMRLIAAFVYGLLKVVPERAVTSETEELNQITRGPNPLA